MAISTENPLYEFQEGRSYFAGFQLPGTVNEFTIDVLSSAIDNFWGPSSSWFYPIITVYDSEYRKIHTYNDVSLIFRSEEGFWGDREIMLEASYHVRGIDRAAAYVVVHTDAKMLEYAVEITTPSSGYAYMVGSQVVYVPGSGANT
ncbi:MAG: MalM family protein [Rhodospirillales bacterium]|nr:MalM family protein [Rhodospirillales bacterium]MDH3919000.1 MalM family protein [Rhodospirillales bacterium]